MQMHEILDRAAGTKKSFLAIIIPAVATYVLLSFFTGGEAWHGREVTGHFFVAHHEGALEHEVSRSVFYFSLWLSRLIGCLWLLGMAAALVEFLFKRLRKSE